MSDVSATLAERGGRYGAFADHAKIAQGLQEVLAAAPNWSKLDPDMRQALCVISDKMARILNGDPYYDDNWHDIQGYARLVEARIHKERDEAASKQAETVRKLEECDDNWEKDHSHIDWSKVPTGPGGDGLAQTTGAPPVARTDSGYAMMDPEDKLYRSYSHPEDKANSPAYDVGNYRG